MELRQRRCFVAVAEERKKNEPRQSRGFLLWIAQWKAVGTSMRRQTASEKL